MTSRLMNMTDRPDPALVLGTPEPGLKSLYYVGIDQSYSGTGVVVISGEDTRKHRYFEFKAGTSKMCIEERLSILMQSLLSVMPPPEYTSVCIEGAAYASEFNTFKLGMLAGVIRYELYIRGYRDILVVAPTAMKKFAGGNGRAQKGEVAEGVKAQWGFWHKSDNITDAYGLCRMAIARDTGEYVVEEPLAARKKPKPRRRRSEERKIPNEIRNIR